MYLHAFTVAVVCALGSCAWAQSSVQLYGLIGVGLGGSSTSPNSGQAVREGVKMVDNMDRLSRWGIRGSEDLGGGTAVNFSLESVFFPTTGASASPYFTRAAWVGLAGDWGQLKAGRMFTVVDDTSYLLDINGNSALSAYTSVGLVSWLNYNSPIANAGQIQYASPTVAGFEWRVGAVLKDDIKNAAGDSTLWHGAGKARNLLQWGASYTRDKLLLGATLESKGGAGNRLAYSGGARYDFGLFDASATYSRMALKTLGQGYTAGLAIPFGALRVGAQLAYNSGADAAVLATGTTKALELFSTYELSKRTVLVANVNRTRFSIFGSKQVWGTGIRHAF